MVDKTKLVQEIANRTGLAKADSKKALEAFVDIVKENLKDNNTVRISKFCKFETRFTKGRNYKIGSKSTKTVDHYRPHCKFSETFKKELK